jgi:hypothetical protein
MYTASHTCIYI